MVIFLHNLYIFVSMQYSCFTDIDSALNQYCYNDVVGVLTGSITCSIYIDIFWLKQPIDLTFSMPKATETDAKL